MTSHCDLKKRKYRFSEAIAVGSEYGHFKFPLPYLLDAEDHMCLNRIPNDNDTVTKMRDFAISRYGISTISSTVGSFVSSPSTMFLPNNHAQNVVIPKLKIVLRNVMVTDKLTSAFSNDVRKFDTAPPGQEPAKISPSCSCAEK